MIFISFVNKYTKIDRRKIFLAKIVIEDTLLSNIFTKEAEVFDVFLIFYESKMESF